MSALLNGSTTWTNKMLEEKLDENYIRTLHAVLNKSWKQHLTKQSDGHLPPISQAIQVRHTKHSWRSANELEQHPPMDSCTWTHQCWLTRKKKLTFCSDTGCCLEDLTRVDRIDGERERESCAARMPFWLSQMIEFRFTLTNTVLINIQCLYTYF